MSHEEGCCSHHHCCGNKEHGHCCCCHGQTCHVCGSGSQDHEHESCDFSRHLLEMADEAWMEVLKEKMKAHVEATSGKKLDELAKIVAETNNNRWKNKMEAKKGCHNFKEKIQEFFNR